MHTNLTKTRIEPTKVAPDTYLIHNHQGEGTAPVAVALNTMVIVGKEANKRHRHSAQIGFTNWINFEVNRSKAAGNRIVAVKIERSFEPPEELLGANAKWAMSFSEDSIIAALRC